MVLKASEAADKESRTLVGIALRPEPRFKIGVLSDTHGYFDPRLPALLNGVRAILHSGDVGRGDVLDALQSIAPVRAVRGNVDGPELSLPPTSALDFGGLRIEIMHILPIPQTKLEALGEAALAGGELPKRSERFLAMFKEETRVVVFGHSHSPCLVMLGNRLFFNPGSAGKKRFSLPRSCGIMEICGRTVRASLLPLESDGPRLPRGVSLEIEVSNDVELEKS